MKNNRKMKISFFFFIKLLVILLLNKIIKGCPIEAPIYSGSTCTSKYCTDNDFITGVCKIENDIIKTQWLTRMTYVGIHGFRLVRAATFSNGDIIVETINTSLKRYFYGLDKNGNFLFEYEKGNPSFSIDVNDDVSDPYFNIFSVIANKENNNDKKEYLIFIPNQKPKIELYDLKNKKAYAQEHSDFKNIVINYKYMPFKIIEDDKIYTIFATIKSNNFIVFKLNVDDSNANKPSLQIITRSGSYSQNGNMTSCFETATKKIICFFRINKKYNIIAFNYLLVEEKKHEFTLSTTCEFLKCVHVKGNIGGFLYFSGDHPKILFMEYKNGNFERINEVELKHLYFGDSYKFNDFIKISDNKISLIFFKEEGIYIVLLKFIEPDNDIVIRYYSINLNPLHNHKICCDMVAFNYKNYISLSFNAREQREIIGNDHNVISLIFSYPNITDNTIDLENYIFENDKFSSYKFERNLKEFVTIENNVFGYIIYEFKILEIKGCEMFDIILLPKNEPLHVDDILEEDDIIKLKFLNKFNPFNCQIKYVVYSTELNYIESRKYSIHEDIIGSNFNEEAYNSQREIYEGKMGFFQIELKNNLSETCEGNCKLCSIDSNENMVNCLKCKYESDIVVNSGKREKICLDEGESKPINEIINNFDELMEDTDPNESYVINGAGYTVIIKDINEYIEDSTVNIDFTKCEEKLRLNLPPNIKLRLLQINIENEDENSLTDQVEYKVYDENGNAIDLSVCDDASINIEYEITDSSILDLDLISKFQGLGVDVFNIKDEFFNDICRPYSDDGSNSDMILSDRVSDIFQNISLCGGDCEYDSFNLNKLSVDCSCKVKQEVSIEPEKSNFAASITSAFLDSNFGVTKCYKLVFSLKGKLKNAGFWIFIIFIFFQLVIYIYYCYTGILPIKNYIEKEMIENGYIINEDENECNNNTIAVYKEKDNENHKAKNPSYPPKKKRIKTKNKVKYIKFQLRNHIANNLDSKEIIETNGEINQKNKMHPIERKVGDHLIFINAKNTNNYIPLDSLYNLDNYDYEEALEYEDRSFGRIFFIYLMSKEGILNTFYYRQPLELMPLRIIIFIFGNACDIALNCLFYLSDNISDKYHYEGKNAILFSLTNNITISLVSSIVGYCLIFFSQSLVQSTDKITTLFREQDELLKKDKHYKVKSEKNIDIIKEIKKILKCLKIKIVIFLIFENLLMILFLYYVTAFCHVYNSTQTSWLLDSLTSYGISLLTAFSISFIMSIIYKLALKCKCKILYKVTLFIYNGI